MANKKTIKGQREANLLESDSDDTEQSNASSGHKLGQLVGDWFQDDFVRPILDEVASKLGLYLDHRMKKRTARGDKIIWEDEYDNGVDYDFVLELGGSDAVLGVPVAFLECFWRRGSRHSKDKARDDSGKLMPMRHAYPTARFLGILASGDFTKPARELIRSREIDLFYVPKTKVIESFAAFNMKMDYPDKATEQTKAQIAEEFGTKLDSTTKSDAAKKLRELMTETVVQGYIDRVKSSLSALPQEIRIIGELKSVPMTFETVDKAERFLNAQHLQFDFTKPEEAYTYEVTYSDGMEFSVAVSNTTELKELNKNIKKLADHMGALIKK